MTAHAAAMAPPGARAEDTRRAEETARPIGMDEMLMSAQCSRAVKKHRCSLGRVRDIYGDRPISR